MNICRGLHNLFMKYYVLTLLLLQVDHFSYTNDDTFDLKYLVNDKYWDVNKGPIFFYTGNEGRIEDFSNNTVSFCVNILTP